jgi:hypothetical protein
MYRKQSGDSNALSREAPPVAAVSSVAEHGDQDGTARRQATEEQFPGPRRDLSFRRGDDPLEDFVGRKAIPNDRAHRRRAAAGALDGFAQLRDPLIPCRGL